MKRFRVILILTFLFIFGNLSAASGDQDELKELLNKSGNKRIKAILSIKDMGRHDLLGLVSEILKKEKSDHELRTSVITLYSSYGNDIDRLLPHWIDDMEWILLESKSEDHYLQIFQIAETRKDRRFLYPLINFIKHPSYKIRIAVFKTLAVFNDDRLIPFFFELGNSPRGIYRYYYLEALPYIKDERIMSMYHKLLSDPSPGIRSECMRVAEKIGIKEKNFQYTNIATGDENYEVRKHALQVIKKHYLKGKSYIFQKTIFDSNEEVRSETIDAITLLKDPYYAKYLSMQMEKENKSELRLNMIHAMMLLGSHGGGQGLSVALRNDPDPGIRAQAALAIGVLNANVATPTLLSAIKKDPALNVRIEAIRAAGQIREKIFNEVLLEILSSPKESTPLKKQAILSLEEINDLPTVPLLYDRIDAEEDIELRKLIKKTVRNLLYKNLTSQGKNKK